MSEAEFRRAFAGRRILVTGHSGFKGGWLCLWLRRLGAAVVGVSLPAEPRSLHNAIGLDRLIDGRIGDIRSREAFQACLAGADFDLVFHLAAQPIVRRSFVDPIDTYLTNVVGTAVVLEAARAMPSLRAIVVVTSDKCYANNEWAWGYRETDAMGGHDPYSSSKGCTELVAAAYRDTFFTRPGAPRLATVRAGNVIGGGDFASDRLVPDLVRAMEAGERPILRNPASVRPWQHVFEPLRGYLMVAARLMAGERGIDEAWNFGCDRDSAVDVASLAAMIAQGLGVKQAPLVRRDEAAPAEARLLRLDSTKAFVRLGWKPVYSIAETVDQTAAWYRAFFKDPGRIRAVSEAQLTDYLVRAEAAESSRPTPTTARPDETTAGQAVAGAQKRAAYG
ncbi:CDP-glucose 4,6-dehydratase [Jiella sp. MQZ9-1]|uniref:CDP-glucose 4,6-dehydratase n=1 Tax=Jiella flava TaxID=2816857 RepID=A0A939FW20_9HYPH|nr:CDP-glucose 4,6-dehydratase [Jiella flava]MCD2471442.1 CDP-glucose 4,6-dehydratase [Jiella flava]